MNKETEKPKKFKAIKYGDVFDVSGELAAKAITPQDAAAMESAEKSVFGETQKSGMASVMKSVAELNEERGVVGHDDTTEAIREGGTQITETTVVGHRVISESIGGQLLGRFAMDE
ncbi:late embryogenesis abundant protein D-34-like [Salvia hispanica]|uniref:late embryogenesis abundant protein D-34-like n=1 Tax=Salvia hispanica TaxID=49212 RepID=UPI0020094F7A|nr:late embryogenesis abundant protein D-34-like [Salvia hispanica]XP_047956020.1 late embryogenesis abundant protein D-34-like [Salvia hispanica]